MNDNIYDESTKSEMARDVYIFDELCCKIQLFNRNTAAAAAAAAAAGGSNKEIKTYSISIPSKSYASINLTQFAANVARAVASAAIFGKLLLNVHPPIDG